MGRKITTSSKPLHRGIVSRDAHQVFLLIVFLSSPLLCPRPLAAEMASFDYLDFKDPTGLCFQGNATAKGTGAIQLTTRDLDGSVGLAYYCEPIHLWDSTTQELANFSTTFTFGVSSIIGTTRGGGVTFFLSKETTIPPGGRGDHLGLVNGRNIVDPKSSRFIAVEFDSRPNSWDPTDSPCHMGIDINSLESVAVAKMWDDVFIPGLEGKAQVVYNSISKILNVSLDYNQTVHRLSYGVDLRSELPEWVYVGLSLTTDQSYDPKNITSWSFQISGLDAPSKKKTCVLVAAIAVPLSTLLVLGILCFFLLKFKRAKCKGEIVGEINNEETAPRSLEERHVEDPPLRPEHDHRNAHVNDELNDGHPRHIPFEHLVAATDNFHQSRRLGKGGFGGVYRGFLKDLNQETAIKRIDEYSKHGEKEFAAEVKTISRLQHRNLVKLIGFCHEGQELLLVYEFMPNRSLDYHLYANDDKVLSWPRRHNIALGLASALQYLHEELDKCIVHRDIKPSNILLDSEFNVKLGDFGLARIADHGSTLQSTVMAGTLGYMAPEYFNTGKTSKEADVYSFGIVALELASGRKVIEPRETGRESLLHWTWELYVKGTIMDAIDKKLGITFDKNEAERLMMVGLWCAQVEARSRPPFRQVISALKFEIAVPDLNTNSSNTAQLPYTMVSVMSSCPKSSNGDLRSSNDGKTNHS